MALSARNRVRKNDRTAVPERQCAVTRVHRPTDELIRFVLSPEDNLVPDLTGRLPGRGIWITASRKNVAQAVERRAFARSAKRNVTVAEDMPDLVEHLLLRQVTQMLAMANKAGFVVTGFSKVEVAIQRADSAALIHATDAAPDGSARLDRKFTAIKNANGQTARIISCLTIDQLSLALGRENVVHAAMAKSGITSKFMSAADRLHRFGAGFDDDLTVKTPQMAKVEHG